MCQKCDTPEMRKAYAEVGAEAGLDPNLVNRLILAKAADAPEGEDRWSDPDEYGTITLTKGQAFVIDAALSNILVDYTGQLAGAVEFAKGMGVPLDAVADVQRMAEQMTYTLDALDVVKAGAAGVSQTVEIPDTVAALVGEADGSTT